jgi:hypothetical protein
MGCALRRGLLSAVPHCSAPIPPTPLVLSDDVTQAAAESADRSAVAAYDLQF